MNWRMNNGWSVSINITPTVLTTLDDLQEKRDDKKKEFSMTHPPLGRVDLMLKVYIMFIDWGDYLVWN